MVKMITVRPVVVARLDTVATLPESQEAVEVKLPTVVTVVVKQYLRSSFIGDSNSAYVLNKVFSDSGQGLSDGVSYCHPSVGDYKERSD